MREQDVRWSWDLTAVASISQNCLDQQPPPGEIHPRSEGEIFSQCSVSLGILMTPGSQVCSDYHGRSLIMMTRADYIVYTQTITAIQSHDTT